MSTPKATAVTKPSSPSGCQDTIRLAGSVLSAHQHCHICAFFGSPEEEYNVLLPFIKEGLDQGEKAVNVFGPQQRETHLQWLQAGGIETHLAEKTGQLELRSWDTTHLLDGRFDAARTLGVFQDVVDHSAQAGFPRIRFVTQMGWVKESGLGHTELLEYEAKSNFVWSNQSGPINPVVCTYNLKDFSGDVVIDVMRTHPKVIIGGVLQENPFYVPPEEFLLELSERRRRRAD